jgi:hypothetical protein
MACFSGEGIVWCLRGCPRERMGMMFGPGNAGKTTLVKALRLGLCTAPAFSPEELTHFRNVAIANIIESTTILLGQANIMDPIVHMDPMYIELKESLNKETFDLKEIIYCYIYQ